MLESKTNLLLGVRAVLTQIIELLLRYGIQEKELAKLVRETYVNVAREKFKVSEERECSDSRVAMLTGISRRTVKEVSDSLKKLSDDEVISVGRDRHKISTILKSWHADPEFLDSSGRPKELSRRSRTTDVSFDDLVDRYASDIPAGALLEEMEKVGAIERVGNKKFRVIERDYLPSPADPKYLLRVGSVLEDFSRTVVYNAQREDRPSMFERRSTELIPDTQRDDFESFSRAEAEKFVHVIDDKIRAMRASSDPTDRLVRVGIGVYEIFGGSRTLNLINGEETK